MSTQVNQSHNTTVATRYRAGWIGLFSGENQSKAVTRTLAEINAQERKCAGLVHDQWNFFVRLWWVIVAIVTLGFYVRVPNVIVVTEPMN
jgi:hypothetical protein